MGESKIIIVGAGPAGLAAAVEAASAGAQVILFEKGSHIGGIRDGGIGPFAVESYIQQREELDLTKEDAFNYMMEFTHWKTDARLVSEYINLSADTIDWLADMGVHFTSVGRYYKGAMPTQHNFNFVCDESISSVLERRARSLGAEFRICSPVVRLIQENGVVKGVVSVTPEGNEYEFRGASVILATGGFGGDPEMIQRCGYTPDKDLFYTFNMDHLSADGIKMAWDAGGAHAEMMMDTYIGLPHGYGGPKGTAPALAVLRQPENILINAKGRRFFREDLVSNPGFTGNAVHRQPGGFAYMVLDSTICKQYQEWEKNNRRAIPGPPPLREGEVPLPREPAPFERFHGTAEEIISEAIKSGSKDFFTADSLEELARQMEVPVNVFLETVKDYNAACAAKKDPIFFKAPERLKPITGPRFIAARFFCDTYGGLGGIRISHKAEVLTEDFDPIPGLYACGNDANTIYGDSYPFYFCGNTSGFAYNTGRIAARSSVLYAEGNGA